MIRINKNGKPNKRDFDRAKKEIKANFENINPDQLSKFEKGYYNQVASGKKRGALNAARLRNPETGAFLSKPEAFEVEKRIKSTQVETGFSREEILKNKEALKAITKLAISGEITAAKDTDLLIDFIKRKEFKKITLIDQNGKESKVSIEKAVFMLKSSQKKVFQSMGGEKFTSWNKFTFAPSGKFIEIQYFNPKGLTEEEIESEIEENEDFGFYGSPGPNTKEPETEETETPQPIKKAKNVAKRKTNKKGENKKFNQRNTNKPRNKISKRK